MRQQRTRLHIVGDEHQVVRAHRFQIGLGQPVDRHVHDHHEVLLTLRGTYRAKIDGTTVTVPTGTAICLPAGQQHQPTNPRDGSVVLLAIQVPVRSPWPFPVWCTVVDHQRRLVATGMWLKSLTDTDDPADSTRRAHLWQVFADECERLSTTTDDASPLIQRAIELLAAHMRSGATIGQVCAILGISRPTLNRAFQTAFSLTPQQYLQTMRAENALHALQHSDDSIAEVAASIGLQSERSLRRLLHLHCGLGPRDLRRGNPN